MCVKSVRSSSKRASERISTSLNTPYTMVFVPSITASTTSTLFMAAAPLVLKTGASRKISLRSASNRRKQRVEADDRGIGDLPLQRTGQTEPFLLMLVDVVARKTRTERIIQRGQRSVRPAQSAQWC